MATRSPRLAKELPNRSRVGGLFINKSGPAGDFNRTQAVDASVGVGQALALSSFVATTNGPGAGNNEYAWDVSGNLNTRTFVWTAQVREIGEGFNPGSGFPAPRRIPLLPVLRDVQDPSRVASRNPAAHLVLHLPEPQERSRGGLPGIGLSPYRFPLGSGTRERRSTPGSTSSPKASTSPSPSAAPT